MRTVTFRKPVTAAMILAALSLCCGQSAQAQPQLRADVSQLKAAFVYNFSKYFSWPDNAKWNDSESFTICIDAGLSSAASFRSLDGQSTQNKTIRLRELGASGADSAKDCHIWYIGAEGAAGIESKLASVSDSDVLTVSDMPGFNALGGIIELVIVDNRIRFRVDTDAASARELTASSFLLRLAIPDE